MGSSTTQQLIAKGKRENGYNNSGIATDPAWVDFFNDALRDLVEDLNIVEMLPPLNYTAGTREVDLPSDYYGIVELYDGNGCRVCERRTYMQQYPCGYFVMFRGSKHVMDFYNYMSSQSFTGIYMRYAKTLTYEEGQIPEISTVGERALVYYAISKALANNNETELSVLYDSKYNEERKKIRTATSRARGS